ncbi:hypothetical protein [Treponema sp. Marseille-Q3903]|uniref:hypothetical protein n=1 Tax=Treponema sp. Marseille-Q3903 TaxID=2766703 RepID=UPI0016526CBF|nr:hypothetical protein [Treponema sp. Marseille-Q3903]MBC6713594.1 hypothetical protein [Treponema sp. Marseille-Q3903]
MEKDSVLNYATPIHKSLIQDDVDYGTPFFMNLNVRDVGHTFVFGPTGAGMSTLLALLMAQQNID